MAQDKKAYNREYYQKNKWRWEQYYNKDNTPPEVNPDRSSSNYAARAKAKEKANAAKANEWARKITTAKAKEQSTTGIFDPGYQFTVGQKATPAAKRKKKSLASRAASGTRKAAKRAASGTRSAAKRTAKIAKKAAKKAASYISRLFGGSSSSKKNAHQQKRDAIKARGKARQEKVANAKKRAQERKDTKAQQFMKALNLSK